MPSVNDNRHKKYNRSLKGLYRRLKRNHLDLGIKGKVITLAMFVHLREYTCDYCGGELPDYGPGIDRKDSSKGYSLKNCVPCCTICNCAKKDLSEKEFKNHIKNIYLHWASK